MKVKKQAACLGLYLAGLGLALAPALIIMSLPQVGMGIWPQSELGVAYLHFSSALCAAGLFLVSLRYRRLVGRAVLSHPFVLFPLAIISVSIIFMPFHHLPVRSLMGSPQNGEGIIWWLDIAVLTAAALLLFRFRFARLLITFSALGVFAYTGYLTYSYFHFQTYKVPYNFSDYLALNVFCFIPVIQACFPLDKNRCRKILAALLYFSALFILYETQNLAAIAYGLLGIPFFVLLSFLPQTAPVKKKIGIFVLAALPAIAAMGMYTIVLIAGDGGYYGHEKIQALHTVLSRGHLAGIGLRPLFENPVAFLTGTGWGTYTEHVVRNLPTAWLDFTREYGEQWDGLLWDHFHSHNIFVETLFSAGLPAMLVLLGFLVSIPLFAKKNQQLTALIFAGSWLTIGSFWFLLPYNVPYLALALGALGGRKSCSGIAPFMTRKAAVFLMPAFAAQVIVGSITALTAVSTHEYMPQKISVAQARSACPREYNDFGAGGIHLARVMTGRLRAMRGMQEEDKDYNEEKFTADLKRLNHLFCQSTLYIKEHRASNRLRIARLLVRGEALLGFKGLDEQTRQFYEKGWRDELHYWLDIMPARTDQAVPYMLWHFLHGKEDQVAKMADFIHQKNPADPVGLWFTGSVMTADSGQITEGVRRMREALDRGIERYMPVDENLKRQLTGR